MTSSKLTDLLIEHGSGSRLSFLPVTAEGGEGGGVLSLNDGDETPSFRPRFQFQSPTAESAIGSGTDFSNERKHMDAAEENAVITVSGLTYTYPGAAAPAVRDISFSVREGEIFGFLGPSGAGKSTTQKILTGLLDDYAGRAIVLGDEVAAQTGAYYERIGISWEAPNHYLKLTGRENLELFGSLYEGEMRDPMEVLELVGLADDADTSVGDYLKGMKGRLNIARALLHDPDLLFLDEPTSGLDPMNARDVKDIVLDLQTAGTTVFITTHNMSVADQLCDRVAFMIDGELPVIDTPKALKMTHGKRLVRVEVRRNGQLDSQEFALDTLDEDEPFDALVDSGDIETIHTEEATLEDVFLAVTGEELQ